MLRQFVRGAGRPAWMMLVALSTATACGATTEPAVRKPGDTSIAIEVFGGMVSSLRHTTIVDSASAHWQKIACDPSISTSPCMQGTLVAGGAVSTDATTALFAAIRAPTFLSLPSELPGGSGPEVDGVHYTLLVSIGKMRQLVQWNSGAALPPDLQDFLSRLSAATGNNWQG